MTARQRFDVFRSAHESDRLLPQRVIAKHQRGHRFHDRDRSRENARIMASARRELAFLF
jgi:gluconate kinase